MKLRDAFKFGMNTGAFVLGYTLVITTAKIGLKYAEQIFTSLAEETKEETVEPEVVGEEHA